MGGSFRWHFVPRQGFQKKEGRRGGDEGNTGNLYISFVEFEPIRFETTMKVPILTHCHIQNK